MVFYVYFSVYMWLFSACDLDSMKYIHCMCLLFIE